MNAFFYGRGSARFAACFAVAPLRRVIFWFRVFGWGLHLSPTRGHFMLFSERYGYRKATYLGPLRVEVLRPADRQKAP
jgi:hypothetical protein